MNPITHTCPPIEWGTAGRACQEKPGSGDQHLVESFPGGVLVTVVNGLGHDEGAAAVANMAIGAIEGHAHEPVTALVDRCHQALRRTRGVKMSMASFSALESKMTWLGVGPMTGVLLTQDNGQRAYKPLSPRNGVVGADLLPSDAASIPVERGDTLILATNGICEDLIGTERSVDALRSAQQIAEHLVEKYSQGKDDTLVLVARYVGGALRP